MCVATIFQQSIEHTTQQNTVAAVAQLRCNQFLRALLTTTELVNNNSVTFGDLHFLNIRMLFPINAHVSYDTMIECRSTYSDKTHTPNTRECSSAHTRARTH